MRHVALLLCAGGLRGLGARRVRSGFGRGGILANGPRADECVDLASDGVHRRRERAEQLRDAPLALRKARVGEDDTDRRRAGQLGHELGVRHLHRLGHRRDEVGRLERELRSEQRERAAPG